MCSEAKRRGKKKSLRLYNIYPCHSEHREESREEEERFIADALNDKESALNDRVEERAVHVGANLCVHPS